MTQSLFPTSEAQIPQQAAPADGPAGPAAPPAGTPEAPDRRKRILAVVAGAAVLVVGGAAFLMLRGHSAAPTPVAPAIHHPVAKPAAAGAFNASAFPTLPKAFTGQIGRDPFTPLVTAPPPSAAPSGAAAPAAPTTSSGTTPVIVLAPAPAPSSGGGATTAAQADWIDFDSQSGTSAGTFLVHFTNGTVQPYPNVAAPAQGKSTAFGNGFQLLSLQNGFAVVQYNGGSPFDVLQGYSNRHMLN